MWKGHRVAVVIPAFDEERLIGRTVSELPDYVDRIVVVDDASRDGTWRCLGEVLDLRLIRVQHRANRGVGAAIVTGYLHALRQEADILVVMAGDHQMLPGDMPQLLDAIVDGADYAKGNRFLHPEAALMPLLRRWGSRYLSWLTRRATGLAVDDCQCGYTALRAQMACRVPLSELWPRYGYPNDLLALLARRGARVVDVPVRPVYASESSGLHAGHVVSISWRIIRRARSGRGAPPAVDLGLAARRSPLDQGDGARSSTGTSRWVS